MIKTFTLKQFTNYTARTAAKNAVKALTGKDPETKLMTGDLCAFWTPSPGGVICEVARPDRIAPVLGDLLLESHQNNLSPMMMIYQHEDDNDEKDKFAVVKAAQLIDDYFKNNILQTYNSHVFVMGVVSDELRDDERTKNKTEFLEVGALIDPIRFDKQ